RSLTAVRHTLAIEEPKTDRGHRTIGLDTQTVALLRAHRTRQSKDRLRAESWTDRKLVFAGPDGDFLHPDAVSKRFRELVDRAGLPRIPLHGLRHTHASLAIAAGTNLAVLSRRLGHGGIEVTVNIYTHVTPATDQEAADKVAGLI